jgi:hypothetical protein
MANVKTIEVGSRWKPKRFEGAVEVRQLYGGRVGYVYLSGLYQGGAFFRGTDGFLRAFEPLKPEAQLEARAAARRASLAFESQGAAKPTTSVFPPHLLGTATTEPIHKPWPCVKTGRTSASSPNVAGNPKDAIGSKKTPTSTVPGTIEQELGLAFLEGALKYGRHNYRAAPVRASVYVDAARRHMQAWYDAGQNTDPDSGLSHLIKAMACLGIIRDTQICKTLIDDRPPSSPIEHVTECNAHAARLIDKYPHPVPPYTAQGHDPDPDAGPDHE